MRLIENTVTGELQEVEVFDASALAPEEIDRGIIPDATPPGMARWDGEKIVIDEAWLIGAALAGLRSRRGLLLAACDYTQLPDCPHSTSRIAAWAAYRQALRDLPQTVNPLSFEWPTPPGED